MNRIAFASLALVGALGITTMLGTGSVTPQPGGGAKLPSCSSGQILGVSPDGSWGCATPADAGAVSRRVPPDNNDLVVWKLDENPDGGWGDAMMRFGNTAPGAPDSGCYDLVPYNGLIDNANALSGQAGVVGNALLASSGYRGLFNICPGTATLEGHSAGTVSGWVMALSGFEMTNGCTEANFIELTNGVGPKPGQIGVYNQYGHQWGGNTKIFTTDTEVTFGGFSPGGGYAYLTPNVWYFVVVTYSDSATGGNGGRLYLNGNLVETRVASGPLHAFFAPGTSGYWHVGGMHLNSGNSPCPYLYQDIRIANVDRGPDWVRTVWVKATQGGIAQ